jgi:hypothetical protein
MSVHSWLQNLRSALAPGRGHYRNLRRTYRPNVEVLEDRLTPSFGPATSYPVGPSPAAVATGDFNNDGHLDLATANAGDSTVSVLLGNSRGGFGAASNFATGAGPSSVAAGDFDGDGKLDLVTADPSLRYVSVLFGNGDGAFQPPATIDTSIGNRLTGMPMFMAVADFNTDGLTDLVFATTFTPFAMDPGSFPVSAVEVLLSYGRAGFEDYSNVYEQASGTPSSLVVADLNTNGTSEVALTSTYYDESTFGYYGYLTVMLNGRGVGGYFEVSPFSRALAVGDFNRDGIPDLLTDGAFWDGTTFGTGISTATSNGVADFNGDGALDLDTGESILLGLGDGTFAAPINNATGAPRTVGDFNQDGRPDEALTDAGSNKVGVSLNDGAWPPMPPLLPAVRIGDVTVTEGNTGTTAANFIVTLSAAGTDPITVAYTTADRDATAGSDYQGASGTLTFAPGETSTTITVLVNGDREGEFNESFGVNLSAPTNAVISDGVGVGLIVDDEPRISITPSASHSEGNTGTTPFAFTVSLSSAYDAPVTVDWATADGAATAGSDYQAASGTLTIPAGQTQGTITVLVNGDRLPESNENFYVNLSNATHAAIIYGFSEGVILDDEPRISISDVTRYEGKKSHTTLFTFTVTLSVAYDQPVTMSYRTVDGTATTSDNDYVVKSGTLTFAAGETTKTITIVVNGDSKKEADETFYLDLFGNSSNSLFTKNRGIGTILNDD